MVNSIKIPLRELGLLIGSQEGETRFVMVSPHAETSGYFVHEYTDNGEGQRQEAQRTWFEAMNFVVAYFAIKNWRIRWLESDLFWDLTS